MSSFNNAAKSHQKRHRERVQVSSRAHLGPLEKKKDYKERANDFHRKKNTLKALKRKALDRNPDEFYFKMTRTQLKDGKHQTEDETPKYTPDQLKLMSSQDIRYVNYKRSVELKKVDKLKSEMHLLHEFSTPQNKHVVFKDSKKEVAEFDPAAHLGTHPALVGRAYNRPRLEDLRAAPLPGGVADIETLADLAAKRKKNYKELERRMDRQQQLHITSQKMEIKRQLLDKTCRRKMVSKETVNQPAVYKWVQQRKR